MIARGRCRLLYFNKTFNGHHIFDLVTAAAGTHTRCTGAMCAGGRVAVALYRTQVVLAAHVTGRVAAARLRLDWLNSRFAAMWLGGLRR